ncbi:MAG: hypothetical protein OEN52_06230 [Gammaproteobacteria bacterium]|nr:hypothetical protein [Gammaproteobacteria bacterium]
METLRASEIFSDSRCMLIAIESVDFRYDKSDPLCRMHGKIEPVALIVCAPDTRYALDMQARPAALDLLRQAIPELDAMMAPFNNAPI